jgi:hypothetical protein
MNKIINKIYLLFSFIILFSLSATAQNKTQDVIYLFDGTIIRGTIIEHEPGKPVKIQTDDKVIYTFNQDQIAKIKTEEVQGKKQSIYIPQKDAYVSQNLDSNMFKPGFIHIIEFDFTFGHIYSNDTNHVTNFPRNSYGACTINGYRFSQYLSAGLGIGISYFKNDIEVPLFIDIRSNLSSNPISPYIYLDGGLNYELNIINISKIYMINFGFGLDLITPNNKNAWLISVGYLYQGLQIDFPANSNEAGIDSYKGGYLNLRTAFSF